MCPIASNDEPLYRWTFGNCDFDEAQQRLQVDGRDAAIESKPLKVLAELLRAAGNVIAKDELIVLVWRRPHSDGVLTTAVRKLRIALGEYGAGWIATVHGMGYRLAGPVQRETIGRKFSSTPTLPAESTIFGGLLPATGLSFDAADHLDDETVIAGYLNAALEDENPDAFLQAIADVAKARGMARLARDAGLGRESLHKALAPGARPRYDMVIKLVRALGVELHTLPVQADRA